MHNLIKSAKTFKVDLSDVLPYTSYGFAEVPARYILPDGTFLGGDADHGDMAHFILSDYDPKHPKLPYDEDMVMDHEGDDIDKLMQMTQAIRIVGEWEPNRGFNVDVPYPPTFDQIESLKTLNDYYPVTEVDGSYALPIKRALGMVR